MSLIFSTLTSTATIDRKDIESGRPHHPDRVARGIHRVNNVATLSERQLAEWVFGNSILSSRFWEELQLPWPATVRFGVTEPFVSPRMRTAPGDIDVLVCDPDSPEWAVAFECKRVKVPAAGFDTHQVSKLRGLRKAGRQVRGLRDMGFSRTFLFVFMAVDGQERLDCNLASRGPTPVLVESLDQALQPPSIAEGIGFVVLELVQPTSRSLDGIGAMGIRVRHPAIAQHQPAELTAALRAFL